jgi:hypothetical protein
MTVKTTLPKASSTVTGLALRIQQNVFAWVNSITMIAPNNVGRWLTVLAAKRYGKKESIVLITALAEVAVRTYAKETVDGCMTNREEDGPCISATAQETVSVLMPQRTLIRATTSIVPLILSSRPA